MNLLSGQNSADVQEVHASFHHHPEAAAVVGGAHALSAHVTSTRVGQKVPALRYLAVLVLCTAVLSGILACKILPGGV